MFPVVIVVIYKAPGRKKNNHELELKVNLVFSAPLPGWTDDEEEIGKGEMMATITEISKFEDVGVRDAPN